MEISAFVNQLVIVGVLYAITVLVVLLDLIAGVRKAKRAGSYRSSQGFRRTVDKLVKYFNLMLAMTCIDAIQMVACYTINMQSDKSIPLLTIFTVLGCIFIGFIELKSIYESNEDKDKAKFEETAKMLKTMLSDEKNKEILKDIFDKVYKN